MKKTKEIEKYLRWKFKLRALKFVRDHGSINAACEIFEISRTTYFNWKRKYDKYGEEGLLRKKRDSQTYWNKIDKTTVDLILKLREEHKLGTWRIKWYLERYGSVALILFKVKILILAITILKICSNITVCQNRSFYKPFISN